MTVSEFYDALATADINADEEVLTELAHNAAAPPPVQTYALCKATAIKARLDGRVTDAVRHERIADDIYTRMPKRYRW